MINFDMDIINGRTVTISNRSTDKKIIWNNASSVDGLSLTYYTNEKYWRIIMMANPAYSMPFDIKNGDIIRIPLPFDDVVDEISNKIKNYNNE